MSCRRQPAAADRDICCSSCNCCRAVITLRSATLRPAPVRVTSARNACAPAETPAGRYPVSCCCCCCLSTHVLLSSAHKPDSSSFAAVHANGVLLLVVVCGLQQESLPEEALQPMPRLQPARVPVCPSSAICWTAARLILRFTSSTTSSYVNRLDCGQLLRCGRRRQPIPGRPSGLPATVSHVIDDSVCPDTRPPFSAAAAEAARRMLMLALRLTFILESSVASGRRIVRPSGQRSGRLVTLGRPSGWSREPLRPNGRTTRTQPAAIDDDGGNDDAARATE